MKSCPACHRAVPDTAKTCPHQGCGQALQAAHTGVKRPPPPPTRVHVAGKDSHSATPQTAAKQSSSGQPKPWQWPLVLSAAILLTSGLTAALTAFMLRGGQKQEVASTQGIAPQAESKTAAKAAEPKLRQPPARGAKAPMRRSDKSTGRQGDGESGAEESEGAAKHGSAVLTSKVDVPPLGSTSESLAGIAADAPIGLYAERTEPKTAEFLGQRGGTIASQKAVEDGLNWLGRHQGEDGHWGADCLGTGANSRCDEKAPCQGTGEDYEIGQTGLALLAFQAAGHYYFNGQKYSAHVAKGLDYCVQEQAPDGSIVGSKNPTAEQIKAGASFEQNFMYEHAMATFALCEACAVAVADGKKPDLRYQTAAERAVSFIENLQHDDGGWRYTVAAGEPSDCSVSGWVMLALKTAREANISVSPKTISRMMDFFAAHYLDDRQEAAKGRLIWDWISQPLRSYHGTYYVDLTGGPLQVTTYAMTGVGMMAVEFFEHKLDAPIVQWGAPYLADKAGALAVMNRMPARPPPGGFIVDKSGPTDVVTPIGGYHDAALVLGGYYIWYNCTMAMFQAGGEPWKRWNSVIRDHVVSLQVQGEGCERGSWPPDDAFSDQGGRVYSTALAVLTLEVYYRFQRVAGQPEKEKFFEK